MQILCVRITKRDIHYAILSNESTGNIELKQDNKISISQNLTTPDLMRFLKDTFDNLLGIDKINKVIYWCEKEGKANLIMPLGVLNLCCQQFNIPTDSKYSANLTDKKLGFDTKVRGNKVIKRIDEIFPNCSYKNDEMRKTIAIGLLAIREAQ